MTRESNADDGDGEDIIDGIPVVVAVVDWGVDTVDSDDVQVKDEWINNNE